MLKFPKALPLITAQPCIPRGNLFTAFLCSTNTRKDLHPLLCFCLFSMNSYTEGKPLSSSWPVQRRDQKAQGNGIPGNVHCPVSHKCHQEGTGPGAPHTQKIQIRAQLPAIKLQIKRTITVDVLCLLSALSLVA